MKPLIALGNFFFKYRNRVFPLLMLGGVLLLRPRFPAHSYGLDLVADALGLLSCLIGQGLRAAAVGYEYIKRGGKQKQIWAGRIVQGGLFGHTRNPLYLGNILIFLGITLIFGSLAGVLVGNLAVVFIYFCIILAEEDFLRNKFGADYDAYVVRVNRFWPRWKGFSSSIDGMVFRWKRVVSNEYGTVFGWVLAALGLRVWTLALTSRDQYRHEILGLLLLLVPLVLIYGWVRWLKKSGRLAEEDVSTVDGR